MKDDIRIYLKELRWEGWRGIDWIPVASDNSHGSALCEDSNEISNAMRKAEFLFLTEWLLALTAKFCCFQLCAVSSKLSEI